MIGQGVNNFGRLFGPLAAALLMAGWVGLLARQDLLSRGEPARLLLYGLGLVLTFNLGRDVTLLVLYPFLFGSLLYWWWEPVSAQTSGRPGVRDGGLRCGHEESALRTRNGAQTAAAPLRPIDFDDEDPEAGKSLRETAQETPPTPPVTPPPARPMTPPEGFFDDDQSSR